MGEERRYFFQDFSEEGLLGVQKEDRHYFFPGTGLLEIYKIKGIRKDGFFTLTFPNSPGGSHTRGGYEIGHLWHSHRATPEEVQDARRIQESKLASV